MKNLSTRSNRLNPEPADSALLPIDRRYIYRFGALLALLFSTSYVVANESMQDCAAKKPDNRLVIIIDDMGHNLSRGRKALALPGKLNFAVIPYTRYGAELAESAHSKGKEVLVHVPMSTVEPVRLGKGGLTADLTRDEFRNTLAAALEQIPQARGINNHMGSGLTQQRLPMAWLMQELRSREMYFVDSRTSQKTIAATVAGEFNVPHLSRHVFLDNERSAEAIDARFKELLYLAQRDGIAVAIGHPYPETINYLREALLTVHDQGLRPVFVSEALIENALLDKDGLHENRMGASDLLEDVTTLHDSEDAVNGCESEAGVNQRTTSAQSLTSMPRSAM